VDSPSSTLRGDFILNSIELKHAGNYTCALYNRGEHTIVHYQLVVLGNSSRNMHCIKSLLRCPCGAQINAQIVNFVKFKPEHPREKLQQARFANFVLQNILQENLWKLEDFNGGCNR